MRIKTHLEGFIMLLPWLRNDAMEGDVIPGKARLFQWGYVNDRQGKARGWYILLMLPSYSYKLALTWDRPMWHQAGLLFKEHLTKGDGYWQIIDFPMWDGRAEYGR